MSGYTEMDGGTLHVRTCMRTQCLYCCVEALPGSGAWHAMASFVQAAGPGKEYI
jgi:hypothetical protein